MADINLQEVHDLLVSVALEAGEMILAATPTTVAAGTKKNSTFTASQPAFTSIFLSLYPLSVSSHYLLTSIFPPVPLPLSHHPPHRHHTNTVPASDLVTETDRAVETMVSTRLQKSYPSFSFIGEETYTSSTVLTASPTFIVDPIDGTTNFVHGHPGMCISLGLTISHLPVVGVVFQPFTSLLYTAIKGKGAYMTQGMPGVVASLRAQEVVEARRRLPLRRPEPLQDLSTALVAVEWGSDRSGANYDTKTRIFRRLAASKEDGGAMVHSLRSLGSAALNICHVAAGFVDLYWEGGCWAWDVAAGWCILEEAGGRMVDGNAPVEGGEGKATVDGRVYLAVRGGEGQEGILTEFWGVLGGERLLY